jgi:hypothetical protein
MVLRLQGGLGNQIFQLLALRYLKNLHPREREVIFTGDLSKFRSPRDLSINSFIKNEELISDINWIDHLLFQTKISKVLSRFSIHAVNSVRQLSKWDGQYLNGYFQDIYNYPDHAAVKAGIKELDQVVKEQIPVELRLSPSDCAVHLRLTDFAETKAQRDYLHSYRLPYIKQSIRWFRDNKSIKRFILFSDDPKEAQNLIDDDVILYKDLAAPDQGLFKEFCAFSSFQNIIGSNSTFSFWGGLLGCKKQIVFPATWDKLKPKDEMIFQKNLASYNNFSEYQHSIARI